MKTLTSALIALSLSVGMCTAQQYASPAYPDNWYGGPPLPPVGQGHYYAPQPRGYYVQPRAYVTQTVTQTYTYQVRVPAVQGPANARCILANLNGNPGYVGCARIRFSPAEQAHLRKKFSNYRPNSGYTLNLPTDSDYLRN